MNRNEPPTVDSLLEHTGFVRSLARGALGTDDQSDDVAQDAFVAAIEKGPRDAKAARSWFYRVVKNRVTSIRRKEASRRKYLQADHEAKDVPSPEEILQREEARIRLVAALLELDPIYREPLVLKYYEGLSPRQIAKRLDERVETIRTRQRRGIERLRERLDDDYGSRKAWVVCMIPLTRLHKGAAATTVSATTIVVLSVAAVVAVGVATALALSFGSSDSEPTTVDVVTEQPPVEAPGLTGTAARQPLEDTPTTRTEPTAADSAFVVITVEDDAGDPVPEAVVTLTEWRRGWTSPRIAQSSVTDAEGQVRFPRTASPDPGDELPDWWYGMRVVQPESRDDLRDVVIHRWRQADTTVQMARGFSVSGEVIDRMGRGVPGAFVTLRATDRSKVVETDGFGRFRVTGLPPRRWQASVSLRSVADAPSEHEWTLDSGTEGVRLEVSAGRRLVVHLGGFDAGDSDQPLRVTEYDPRHVTGERVSTHVISLDGSVTLYGLREDRHYALWWAWPGKYETFLAYRPDVSAVESIVTLQVIEDRPITLKVPRPAADWKRWPRIVARARGIEAVATWLRHDADDARGDEYEIRGLPDGEYTVTAEGNDSRGRVMRGEMRVRAGESVTFELSER